MSAARHSSAPMDRSEPDLLKPPVGNKLLFEDSAFIIMASADPIHAKIFTIDPSEEFS